MGTRTVVRKLQRYTAHIMFPASEVCLSGFIGALGPILLPPQSLSCNASQTSGPHNPPAGRNSPEEPSSSSIYQTIGRLCRDGAGIQKPTKHANVHDL